MFGCRGPHTELGAHGTTGAEYVVVSYIPSHLSVSTSLSRNYTRFSPLSMEIICVGIPRKDRWTLRHFLRSLAGMTKRGVERSQLPRKLKLIWNRLRSLRFPMLTLEMIKTPKVDNGQRTTGAGPGDSRPHTGHLEFGA